MSQLTPPVAIVTGAQGGVGRATVDRLLSDGYRVIACDVAEPAAWRDAPLLTQVTLDITDEDAVVSAFASIKDEFGAVSLLVNNAAVQEPGSLLETRADSFRRVIDVNLTGAFLMARSAVALMTEAGGTIVNVASVLGKVADGDLLAYTCSKSAMLGLTRAIAVKYAKSGIRCNAVCPGDIATSMSAEYFDFVGDQDDIISRAYPMGRVASVEEVANTIAYLGSPQSAYITGQTVVIDGGLLAQCY